MAKRKRNAAIDEVFQPAPEMEDLYKTAARAGFLPTVYMHGAQLHFHGTAVITGDGLYRGYNGKGELKHGIVTNKDACTRQSEYMARIGRR